ncbi:MAG: HPr family phosphocarrier protein [Gammaproteobacteria bacterium]
MTEVDLPVVNRLGLHARAAARFATTAAEYASRIEVSRDGRSVNGKSIMGLMMLAAGCGSTLHVRAEGPDADAAIAALRALVAERFGEEE